MKGIACAFEARLGRDAEIKTARTSGKQFVAMSVIEGEGDDAQWINVVAWSESLADIASHLVRDTKVYIEGKIRLRSWEGDGGQRYGLSVSAALVQPLALIGRSRPKAPRKSKTTADPHAPLETTARRSQPNGSAAFADGSDVRQGDSLPF